MRKLSIALTLAYSVLTYSNAIGCPNLFIANCCNYAYLSLGGGALFTNKETEYKVDSESVLFTPTQVGSSLFNFPNVNWHNKFKDGFDANIAIGCKILPKWRFEGEFLYQNTKREIGGIYDWREINATTGELFAHNTDNPLHNTSSTANIYSFMANNYFDFINCSRFTPYIGAGIGIAWISSPGTRATNVLNIDVSNPPLNVSAQTIEYSPALYGSAFAWQFKAGLGYKFTCNTSVALQYRFFGTEKLKARQSSIITNPNTSGDSDFSIPEQDVNGVTTNNIELIFSYKI